MHVGTTRLKIKTQSDYNTQSDSEARPQSAKSKRAAHEFGKASLEGLEGSDGAEVYANDSDDADDDICKEDTRTQEEVEQEVGLRMTLLAQAHYALPRQNIFNQAIMKMSLSLNQSAQQRYLSHMWPLPAVHREISIL